MWIYNKFVDTRRDSILFPTSIKAVGLKKSTAIGEQWPGENNGVDKPFSASSYEFTSFPQAAGRARAWITECAECHFWTPSRVSVANVSSSLNGIFGQREVSVDFQYCQRGEDGKDPVDCGSSFVPLQTGEAR